MLSRNEGIVESIEGEMAGDRAGEQSGSQHELTASALLSSKILGFKDVGFGGQAHEM